MPDIVDTAINAGSFDTLTDAITAAGLDTALKTQGPFTVFAPTDEAFSKLPSGTFESLLQDIPRLRRILEYHVVQGKVEAADVVKLTQVTTVEGSTLKIDTSGDVKVNDAKVLKTDVQADNGVIHVIDNVLIPPQK